MTLAITIIIIEAVALVVLGAKLLKAKYAMADKLNEISNGINNLERKAQDTRAEIFRQLAINI